MARRLFSGGPRIAQLDGELWERGCRGEELKGNLGVRYDGHPVRGEEGEPTRNFDVSMSYLC